MIPTELFVFRILSSLIPKSIRAGIVLVITLVAFPIGLNELTNVLLEQAGAWATAKCVLGLLIGGIAGVTFYYFQAIDGKPKVGSGLEIISQYHKDQHKSFEVAWTSEDQTNKNMKQN